MHKKNISKCVLKSGYFFMKHPVVVPKYWGKQIFSFGILPEVGQKQKTEKREQERPKVGNNNGQLRIATPPRVAPAKPPGPKEDLKLVIPMASSACERHLVWHTQSLLGQKISFLGFPKVGEKQWAKMKEERRRKSIKSVLTMAR